MRLVVVFAFLVATFVANVSASFSADVKLKSKPTRSYATWRPRAEEPLLLELRFVERLIERGLPQLAADELTPIEPQLDGADVETRYAFGRVALKLALESSRLGAVSERASVAERVASIRALVERDGALEEQWNAGLSASGRDYALALVRTYYALGVVAAESTDDSDASGYLTAAFELAKGAVKEAPGSVARPFVYWSARAKLAQRDASDRFETAERSAKALERASSAQKDAYYFFARLLSIESARERGELERASDLISETLQALATVADAPDAPREIAVGLVAEETRLLAAENKDMEALKVALQDVDLLDAPLPKDLGRFDDEFFDVFADRELARAAVLWKAIPNAPDDESAPISNMPTKKALTDEARRTVLSLRSNVQRARASFFAQELVGSSDEWTTLEAAAEEAFRNQDWQASLDGYDRASSVARESGAEEDARRLERVAAALVDKICREKLYDKATLTTKEPPAWRADARRRFEALARERTDDELAPSCFLLAIEYADGSEAEKATLREEFLELFPASKEASDVALTLARFALDSGEFDAASRALDRVLTASPDFSKALALEQSMFQARLAGAPDEASRVVVVDAFVLRLLSKLGANADDGVSAALESVDWNAPNASGVLALVYETKLASGDMERKTLEALRDALDRWEQVAADDRATLAKIAAFRLSLRVAYEDDTNDVANLLKGLDASSDGALDALERVASYMERAPEETRARLARLTLDGLKKLRKSDAASERAQVVRAHALRLSGASQEALELYATIRKSSPKNVDAARGIALLLTSQADPKVLERAVKYWSDVADLCGVGTPDWWDAKERCVEIYCRVGKIDQAEKMLKTLWLTRVDPSDPARKGRWEKLVRESKRR